MTGRYRARGESPQDRSLQDRGESLQDRRARRADVTDRVEVLAAAARYLEARPRAAAEVRRHLREAGYDGDLVDAAVARLLELGYLDDEAFARAWIESRDRARPRAARVLRLELRKLGVPMDYAEAALAAREAMATGDDPDDPARLPASGERADSTAGDEEAAERLLARRGAALRREPDPRRRRAKAYALLARNGFDPSVAARAAAAFATLEPDGAADTAVEGP